MRFWLKSARAAWAKSTARTIPALGAMSPSKSRESGTGLQPVHPAPSPSRLGIGVWTAIGVLVAALASLAIVHFRATPPPEHTLHYTIAPPDGVQNIHSFEISPDGRTVVRAAAVNCKEQLRQRPLDALQ